MAVKKKTRRFFLLWLSQGKTQIQQRQRDTSEAGARRQKIDLTDGKAQIEYGKSPSIPFARSRALAPNAALFLLKSSCLWDI